MAKKIAGVVCGVAWAVFGLSFLFSDPPGTLTDTGVVMCVLGSLLGIGALIALGVLALIDYARRPR